MVTIVTPSYNMAQYLPETIESVLGRNIRALSTSWSTADRPMAAWRSWNATRDVSNTPPARPWPVSRSFGIPPVDGQILAWLNADDTLLPGAVSRAVAFLEQHADVDVMYGEGWWIDAGGVVTRRYPSLPSTPGRCRRTVSSASRRHFCGPPPTAAASWTLPDMVFDYDLWIRMAKPACASRFSPRLSGSRMHGGAATIQQRRKVFAFRWLC